jgi:parvulin-like peptidyl-prolyl isomerase
MPVLVNDETVEDRLVEREIEMLRPHYERLIQGNNPQELEQQLHEWARENVIERTLLRQEAAKQRQSVHLEEVEEKLKELTEQFGGEKELYESLDVPENDLEAVKNEIEIQLRLEKLIDKVTSKISNPKFKDVSEYYRRNIEQYTSPEVVRASHIVRHIDENTDDETALAAIKDAERRIKETGDFAEVADELSDCPGGGGDLGYFPRGQMVQEFEDVVFSMEIGQISEIFRTSFGYHIAQVTDRRPPQEQPLVEIRGKIEEELLREKKMRAVEDYTDKLRNKAAIEILR